MSKGSREKPQSAAAAIRVPMPARYRGSIRFTRLDEMPAAATSPKQNGRNATPAWIGL